MYIAYVKRPQEIFIDFSSRSCDKTNTLSLKKLLSNGCCKNRHRRLIVSRESIQEQGHRFAQRLGLEKAPDFSKGWVSAFCKRNAFRKFRQHGESGDAPIDTPEVQAILSTIKAEIATYDPEDIYNMDETGLFYNMPPDSTILNKRHVF